MSNLDAVGLIAAVMVGGYVAMLYADKWIHDRGEIVATGLVRGVPVKLLVQCVQSIGSGGRNRSFVQRATRV